MNIVAVERIQSARKDLEDCLSSITNPIARKEVEGLIRDLSMYEASLAVKAVRFRTPEKKEAKNFDPSTINEYKIFIDQNRDSDVIKKSAMEFSDPDKAEQVAKSVAENRENASVELFFNRYLTEFDVTKYEDKLQAFDDIYSKIKSVPEEIKARVAEKIVDSLFDGM